MIFNAISVIRARFLERKVAHDLAARWSSAAMRDPQLREDIIQLGGILAQPEANFENGVEVIEPIDPIRAARAEGERKLALTILALMNVTPHQLSQMTENQHEY